MTKAKYYYESHITIEPIEDPELLDDVKLFSDHFHFRIADLFMLKDRKETPERSNRDTFMTGHGKDLDDIISRTRSLVYHLQLLGITVWRYKIEDTLLDSRNKDVFKLL